MPNTPSPAASTCKTEDEVNAELFRELENALEKDDDDDNDEDIPLSASSRIVASKARTAEPMRPPPPDMSKGKPRPILKGSPAPGPSSTAKSKPPKPSPLVPPKSTVPTPASARQSAPSPDKGKAAPLAKPQTIDVEEEVLEFGKPARRAQHSRVSPAPLSSPIALPGASSSSNGLVLPSPGGIVSLPGHSTTANQQQQQQQQDDEDDEDEWDEVAGTETGVATGVNNDDDDGSIFGDGFADGEEGEEINIDQFAAEMDQELGGMEGGEEDDGDMEDIFGEVEEPVAQIGRPMSLNQFAAGGLDDDPDDDYSSSSDESDDD